jgi:hypothetical protein
MNELSIKMIGKAVMARRAEKHHRDRKGDAGSIRPDLQDLPIRIVYQLPPRVLPVPGSGMIQE